MYFYLIDRFTIGIADRAKKGSVGKRTERLKSDFLRRCDGKYLF